MSYLGNTPTTQNFISGTDYFNGTGSQTAFTLSRTVASVNDIQAVVNNVVQVPNDAYTISGTTITFTSAPSAGTQNVYVRYLSTTTQVITPSQNTVSWSTLDTNTQNDLGLMYKNKIINGAMQVWQRGTSGFTSTGNYSADRWLVSTGTSLSAVGQSSDVPSGFRFSLSVAGTNVPSARQYIESVNCSDLIGQSVTVSAWIKQTSGAGSNAMYIYLANANSSDNFSGLTQIGSNVNITTTSSWVRYTATFTNLPSGAANGLALIIGSNSAGASTFLLTGVQLEVGTQATAFSTAGGSYGAELSLCERYYQRYAGNINGNPSDGGVYTVALFNGTSAYWGFAFPQMRTGPSFSFSSLNDFTILSNSTARSPLTAFSSNGSNTNRIELVAGWSTNLTAGDSAWLRMTSSGWYALSAEL